MDDCGEDDDERRIRVEHDRDHPGGHKLEAKEIQRALSRVPACTEHEGDRDDPSARNL